MSTLVFPHNVSCASAGLDVLGFQSFPWLAATAFAGQVEREPETAFDAASGIDAFLDSDFVCRTLENESAATGVKPFVVLSNDDKINILGFLVLQRAKPLVIQTGRGGD